MNQYIYFITQLKTNKMKQLFCVVVTDIDYVIGLDSPIIFHVECDSQEQAEAFAIEDLSSQEDYGYEKEDVDALDVFSFPVTDLDIIKL
jgi:hypothetical protein